MFSSIHHQKLLYLAILGGVALSFLFLLSFDVPEAHAQLGTPTLTILANSCFGFNNDPFVSLSWSTVTGASDYHIKRCTGTNTNCTTDLLSVIGTSYSDSLVSRNTTYSYRVIAHRHSDGVFSQYSNTQTVTTGSCPTSSFNFSLSNGGNKSVTQGSSVTNSITATLISGTSQLISFTAGLGLPSGVTTSFSPSFCNLSCSTTLTVNTTSSTPTGNHTITVIGTAGGIAYATLFTLTVNTASFNFSLSNGGNKSVTQGSSVTNSITATLSSGTTQSVSFSASGLPSGATASFSPTSCNPTCSTTLTIATAASTPTGSYTITITGTGGGLTRTTSFTLTVNAVAGCINECSTSGATQCSGANIQTCGNYDADACLEWSSATACPVGQTCSGGVCVASQPDLIVTSFSVPNGTPGQTVTAFVTVKNQGTVATSVGFKVGINTTTSISCSNDTYGSVTSALSAGASRTLSVSVTLPSTVGTYTAYAMADSDCGITESIESNNTRSDAYTVSSQPDLVVTSFTVPDGSPGQIVSAAVTVQNQGTASTGSGYEAGINMTTTATCLNETYVSLRSALAAGASDSFSISVTLPSTAGSYTASVMADSDCGITESIESNNTRSDPYTVSSTPPPPPPSCPSTPPSYPSTSWDRVWCDKAFTTTLAGTPDQSLTQFDEDWGSGAIGGIRADDIGFRSGRTINFSAGTYTLTLGSDDGSRLWVDGALCIDGWFDQGYTERACNRTFSSSGSHTLRIDYYEFVGGARVSFAYTSFCTASCGVCGGFSDTCDTTGTQTCTRTDCTTFLQACTRTTDGLACTGGTCSGGVCVPSGQPDLRVTSFIVPNGAPSQTVTASVTVRNYGTVSTGSGFETAIRINGSSMSCGANQDFRSAPGLALAAGSSRTLSISVTLPSTAGSYTATAMADSDCVIAESSETNNTRTDSYTVGPNLTISGLSVPNGTAGTTGTATMTITNNGSQSTGVGFEVGFHDGSPAIASITCSNEEIGSAQTALAAGSSRSITISFTYPSAGTYTARAMVDSDCVITESNEGDNTASDPYISSAVCVPSCQWSDVCDESALDGCGGTCVRDTDGVSCGGSNYCAVGVCTTLSGTLTANPISGNAPLSVNLTAAITSGAWAPTTNFSFWWNCSYADPTPTFPEAEAQCGPINPLLGAKFDGQTGTSYTIARTYNNTTQNPITFNPIVIIEHGSGPGSVVLANATVTVNPSLAPVICTPSISKATPGASRTFNAQGGSGNYAWSISDATCFPATGTGITYTVFCNTVGTREITLNDDDPLTGAGTCQLQVTKPGFGEF